MESPNAHHLATGLGVVSIALGLAEALTPSRIADLVGADPILHTNRAA